MVGSQVAHPAQEEKEEEEDFGELEQIASYRFYAPDSKDNLVFDIDVSAMVEGARPTIKAATIEKLLERLTHENWPDPSLVNTFLLTYRTFTTAQEVIDLLVMRFNIPWPKDTSPELRERYNTAKRIPIRLRVFNVAKNWVRSRHSLHSFILFIPYAWPNIRWTSTSTTSRTRASSRSSRRWRT